MQMESPSSLIGVASTTYRKDPSENQDAVATADNPRCGLRAVIVADGLGSQAHAGLGAQWAVEAAAASIAGVPGMDACTLRQLFAQARVHVKQKAAEYCAREGIQVDPEQSFGTTLIVAVESMAELWLGYVGNGGLWHLRGNFNDLSPNHYAPWNALNYLNPHTVQNEMGKEALYRMISISARDEEAQPAILCLGKDFEYGDIVMTCTDGIFSHDQVNVGRTKDGTTWIKMEPPMLRFFATLNGFFSLPENTTDGALSAALRAYADELRTEHLLDDDASLGVIVTAPTVRYQAGRRRPGLPPRQDE